MTPQPAAKYKYLAVPPSGAIIDRLLERHAPRVYWPVIWYELDTKRLIRLTYEVTSNSNLNATISAATAPVSLIPQYRLDYTATPHAYTDLQSPPIVDTNLPQVLDPKYSRTYDYVQSTRSKQRTIQIYVIWHDGEHWKGLEISTFWVLMSSEAKARYLVGHFIAKRAGRLGAHEFQIQTEASNAANITLSMAFINVERGTPNIMEDSNVYTFPLDSPQAETLHSGSMPDRASFLPFKDWLNTL